MDITILLMDGTHDAVWTIYVLPWRLRIIRAVWQYLLGLRALLSRMQQLFNHGLFALMPVLFAL